MYWNKDIECCDDNEMYALKNLRFLRTLKHVYKNVPHYKEKMDSMGLKLSDIKSILDLPLLPFTYKQDLRDTYPYGSFAVPLTDVVRTHATSGTTGKQTIVGYTKKDLEIWQECCARAFTAIDAKSDDFMHISYGYGLFTGGLGLHYGAETVGMTVIPVSVGNTKRQITIMKDLGSTIIACTPSYALYLADSLKEMGLTKDSLKLRAGFFGGEPWTNEMRHDIEEKLGIRAYDIYGLSEVMGPGVAFECTAQNGMHINEDHFIVETIDPKTGEILPDGALGELVFTCITKEALPLIRYRTRDIARLLPDKCSCGRSLKRMSKPVGRSDDMLIIRGVNVFPSQIESVLLNLGNTSPYYQIIIDRVNNNDTFEIQVELSGDSFSDIVKDISIQEKKISTGIESNLGIKAKVRIVEPNSIPRTDGKAVRIIDNRVLHDKI